MLYPMSQVTGSVLGLAVRTPFRIGIKGSLPSLYPEIMKQNFPLLLRVRIRFPQHLEIRSCHVAQAGPRLNTLLGQPPHP